MTTPDFLAGRTMDHAELAAQLMQIGPATTVKWPSRCRACYGTIWTGEVLARCAKWGWVHQTRLQEAQAALES